MTRFSSAVRFCSILHAFGGLKLSVLLAMPTTVKLAWGQSWRFRNGQQIEGLKFMLGCVTFMVSFPPTHMRWGLLPAFSTPASCYSLWESGLCGSQEVKTVSWSQVPPPPQEGMSLNRKSVLAVSMMSTVCPWDKTLNSDWGLPLTQVPPASAFHTHSCPQGCGPLRSSQTKHIDIKLVFALNHITTTSPNNDCAKLDLKSLPCILKCIQYLP